jgi:CxxC motif-containing protein (DUF1111 family)
VTNPGYGPLDPTTTLSPRVAPAMIGLGLIEAIPEADILAHADPEDTDGDGIRGKAADRARPPHRKDRARPLRLEGAECQRARPEADAFSNDIGISTPDRPDAHGDCTGRNQCRRCRPACRSVSATRRRRGRSSIW